MSTATPVPPRTTLLRSIADLMAALKQRIFPDRPAGPSKDRVRRYLQTGGVPRDSSR